MVKFDKSEFLAGVVVSAAITVMVLSFFLTLADVASKPAVHSAAYAVLQPSLPYSYAEIPDQERATFVSLSGPAPGHLVEGIQ